MLLETITALIESGERVVVTVPNDGPLVQKISARGAAVFVVRTPIIRKSALKPAGLLRLALETARAISPGLSVLREIRPSLVLVNTITAPLWFPLARMVGIPVVCHVHEGEASVSRLLRVAVNLPLLLADKLIVNSRFSRDVLVDSLPWLGKKAVIVYNAVPGPDSVQPPRERIEGSLRLLFVGRLSPRKGPHVAVEALRMIIDRGVDARLDLVGAVFPGYEWYEDQLRQQVTAAGLTDRVAFHGFQHEVSPFAAEADIVLVPSTVDEPFGNTAVEAALAARPLIVSATSGLLEASSELSACIRVEPDNAQEIADAVRTVTGDWRRIRAAAIADSEVAKSRYSPARYGKEIYQTVSSVMRA
ncbi:glycosyltransferase family 4 protein [Microlunatus endophyticus]|nr:glycosyltransferase family 4 protein [Microlunatus endophyticus]